MPAASRISFTYTGKASSEVETNMNLLFGKHTIALIREWTVLPFLRSPQKPMVRLSSLPFSSLSVSRSVSVCVGWRCPPSPALITGQSAVSAAAFTEPAVG